MVQPVGDNSGFVALVGVLVVGSIAVTIASAVLFFGLDFSRSGFLLQESFQAQALARACVDSGLLKLHDDLFFTGVGSLSLSSGTCFYRITNLGGGNRRLQASGTVGQVVRKIEVLISAVMPKLTISSWQDVADFTP